MSSWRNRFLVAIGWLGVCVLGSALGGSCAHAEDNPALPGFRAAASDARAIEIADEVMAALGGRAAWDNTQFVSWRFFDRRNHWWDKWSGDVRIESDDTLILMNIHTKKGRVWIDGVEATVDSTLQKTLETGYAWWVNDSYWVFMPYKLKDSGVALKYLGEKIMTNDKPGDVLELTFEAVGLTPQNKYHVYVDKETRLVTEWSFYKEATDAEPGFTIPWANWSKIGNLMMVGDHGREKDWIMGVPKILPRSVFESPEPVDIRASAGTAHAGGL
jgi:hypothetical protein